VTSRFGHQLSIDWSQNGFNGGGLEDVSPYVNDTEISISWGRKVGSDGDVTLASDSSAMGFELTNDLQLFSPENASSPINGKILPGRPTRYQVTQPPSGGATYTLLSGSLDTFDVEGDPVGVFAGTALDAWGRPGAKKLSTELYSGLRTGDAINLVLDAIGWTGGRDIDPGATYMPWWWEEGTDAATAINKLVHSEGPPAICYIRGGTFVFADRHHRLLDARSQTSQGLYTHIIPAGTGPAGDFKIEAGSFTYDHGIRNIVNSATFAVGIRTAQPIAEVWTSEDPITIASGATVRITVQTTDPFLNAVTPTIANGDIVVQSGSTSAVTLSRRAGQSLILSITAASDTVITRLALRAAAVPVTRTVQVTAADQSSIGIFELREWPDAANPVWANQYDAQVIATKIVGVYANYRPVISFTVVGLDDTYLTEMLQSRISDRITVRNDARGINADFMIERLEHRITELGLIHRLTITCQSPEPVQAANVFTFDVAGQGFNQGAFGADGFDDVGQMFRFDTAGQGFNQGLWAN
jgi:hypothetical protein